MVIGISKQFLLNRAGMLGFLGELEAGSASGASTVYLPPGLASSEVESALDKVTASRSSAADVLKTVGASQTGFVLFWGPLRKFAVMPPFPLPVSLNLAGYAAGSLRELLERDYRIALVLVRLGYYAVGLAQGEIITASKVGTGLVHGRHKKGGSSQQRFQRHREKQAEQFLNRVCGHAREHIEPWSRELDYIVFGGAWTTILSLKKRCDFLNRLQSQTLPPLLEISRPGQAVLESALRRVWSSRVIELAED